MKQFEAFNDRVKRRLGELAEETHREVVGIYAKAGDMAHSTTRVLLQLDAIKAQIHRAIDWALIEANELSWHKDITREMTMPSLQSSLNAHVDVLYSFIKWSGPPGMTEKMKADHHAQQKEALNAELREFSEGVWHPRSSNGNIPSMTTSNTLNIQGNVHGTVQQAGANSKQQATFTMDISTVDAALIRFVEALEGADIDADVKAEMTAEVGTIRIQLKRSKPNLSVIQAAVNGIQQLAIGVSANVLTPYILPLLMAVGLS